VDVTNPAQLDGFDFSSQVAILQPETFERYTNVLYSPEDFAAGITGEPSGWIGGRSNYDTYRLVLNLQENTYYGLFGLSATNSMRLWVDGVMFVESGIPGDSAEIMVSGADNFTVYFIAGPEPTEIIIQRSCFTLYQGGRLSPIHFGEQRLITAKQTLSHMRMSIIVGATLMTALVCLGIYLLFRKKWNLLCFSYVCVLIAIRIINVECRFTEILLPHLDRHYDYLIDYLVASGIIVLMVLYLDTLYEKKTNRILMSGGFFGLAAITIFMLLTQPIVHSRFSTLYNTFLLLFFAAVVVNMVLLTVKNKHMQRIEYFLVLFGCAVSVAIAYAETMVRDASPQVAVNYMHLSTMIFVFINAIGITMYFERTEEELAKANDQLQRDEAEKRRIITENAALERLSRIKTEFLTNMSHDFKTPLTVISGHVQQAARLSSRYGDETIDNSLQRAKEEILRLARMTEDSLWLASKQESRNRVTAIDVAKLIKMSALVQRHAIEKRGNALNLGIPENLPEVLGNADEIVQVVVNLLTNANTHTENGEISIYVVPGNDFATVTVSDTGRGISPDLLPHVFERGITGGDGTGFGLAICKHIVESHGGTISIHSFQSTKNNEKSGTIVTFSVPLHNGAGMNRNNNDDRES